MKIPPYRSIELLGQLLSSADPVSVLDLSERLGVSERTVRYGLAELRCGLLGSEVEIETVPGKGILLPAKLQERARRIFLAWSELSGVERAYRNAEERGTAIAVEVLAGRGDRSIESWMEWLGVSRSTCLRDLSFARQKLIAWGLDLDRNRRRGIAVTASESDVRSALHRLILQLIPEDQLLTLLIGWGPSSVNELGPTPYGYVNEVFDPARMTLVVEAVMEVLETCDLHPSDNDIVATLVKVAVSAHRAFHGFLVEHPGGPSSEGEISEILLRLVDAVCGSALSRPDALREAAYLGALLPSRSGVYEIPREHVRADGTEAIVSSALGCMQRAFGGGLLHDKRLIELLRLHLRSAFSRARRGEHAKNPLLDAVRRQYPIQFDRCAGIFEEVGSRFSVALDNDEIAYIAMYVAAAQGHDAQVDGRTDVKATLICGYGYGAVALLRSSLARQLPWIHVIEQISVFNALDHSYGDTDVVLSTVDVPVPLPVPMIRVNPVLSGSDIRKIKAFAPWRDVVSSPRIEDVLSIVHKHCIVQDAASLEGDLERLLGGDIAHKQKGREGLPSLWDAIPAAAALARASCSDWGDAVHLAASVLFDDTSQAEGWEKDVKSIRDEYGQLSVLPHGICMPHGYPRSAYAFSMTLITLAEPVLIDIPDGQVEMRMIMAVASPNNETQARALDELFCLLEEGEDFVDALLAACSSENLHRRFTELYRRRFPTRMR
ncbi:MAG: PRD domain-containing protein [Coriobacteriaceae bacterium]|nr:PRD domain-containing protein [Coriobacteriaceae bacterium]